MKKFKFFFALAETLYHSSWYVFCVIKPVIFSKKTNQNLLGTELDRGIPNVAIMVVNEFIGLWNNYRYDE